MRGGATKRFMGVLRVTRVLVHHTLSAAVPEMKKIVEHQEIFARELAYLHHSPSPHQLITKLTSSYSSTTAFITLRGPSLTSPTSGLQGFFSPLQDLQAGNLNLWVRLGIQGQSTEIIKRKLMAESDCHFWNVIWLAHMVFYNYVTKLTMFTDEY